MCGRYSLDLSSSKSNFKPETIKEYSNIFEYSNDNISPSSEAPIIINQNKNYKFIIAKWGLIFDWLPKGKTLFNIRSETVREKNFTRDIVDTQKCLIPFNHYFEWKKENDKNQKYKFYFKERPIAYFLGVFQKLNNNIFFSILTRQASKSGQKIHIRCPQIIAIKSQVKNWFKGEGDWLKESYNDINNEDLFELGLKYEKN